MNTFKKLEVSAIVIKDGCKVAGFIGAAAMTGGATAGASLGSAGVGSALLGGSAGLTEGTIMIIAGTDLMLEVSEDAATISLGDNSKVTKSISKIRSVTDPAASLLSIKDIPKNISKGEIFSKENLTTKRPFTGSIPATDFFKILGKKAKKAIPSNKQLSKNDII